MERLQGRQPESIEPKAKSMRLVTIAHQSSAYRSRLRGLDASLRRLRSENVSLTDVAELRT